MSRLKDIGLIAALLAISAAPRAPGLGRFTSLDEPFWLRQGANFYYALGQREFQNTIYEYHPAVTTMWIIAGGMLAYFPQYRALEQGYLKPGKFDAFLPAHGKDSLTLLIVSRAIQVVLILILLVVIFLLLRVLRGGRTAFFATAFISLAPFLVGQSRLLNHEAMLGLFLLISLLALLAYLYWKDKTLLLITSAVAASLAQLTKSSGMPIFPLVMLILAVHAFASSDQPTGERVVRALKTFALWLILAVAAYVIVWPGMWVAPEVMIRDVYGNALSYMLQGARVEASPGFDSARLGLDRVIAGIGLYGRDLVWRTTPLTALGLVAAIGFAIRELRSRADPLFRLILLYSLLLAAAFVVLFGVQQGPKPPHYILTSYVCLDLIAALGLIRAWGILVPHIRRLSGNTTHAAFFGLILALQAASSLSAFPYYISYYNPLVEALQPGAQNPTLDDTGYGVGLDQAAAYLAAKPNAAGMTVMSANGVGCFSYYFPGKTVPMNNFILSEPQVAQVARGSQYVVVDYYNQRRKDLAQDLEGVKPEAIIWFNGIEFLHIYRAADLLMGAK